MVKRFDIRVIIKLTTKEIFNIKLLSIIIYINSKLLHNYVVKLVNTQEKQLIINIMCLQ